MLGCNNMYIYIYIYISGPSKGQVKFGRYTNSRPLPKGHRKPMLFSFFFKQIYVKVMLILGILGYIFDIYSYIRGNPPNPTYTPQPQQQQLLINQFQVYKCQDCLKWPIPKISMKNPWKDYKILPEMSKNYAQVFGGFSRVSHGRFTGFSRSFHGLCTVQILWEISGRYFHQIIFCFVFGDIMI